MIRLVSLLLAGALAVGSLGCSADPVPANPTWVEHVAPILRGNCFNCHGAGPRPMGASRWDVFDHTAEPMRDLGPFTDMIGASTAGYPNKFLTYVKATDNTRMPPEPALRLPDRDIEVLENWAKNPVRGMRAKNARPTLQLLSSYRVGPEQQLTFIVDDADYDEVLGRVSIDDLWRPITRTGAQTHVFNVEELAPGSPITIKLSDGQDRVEVMVGNI
jgi:hypothetical protein